MLPFRVFLPSIHPASPVSQKVLHAPPQPQQNHLLAHSQNWNICILFKTSRFHTLQKNRGVYPNSDPKKSPNSLAALYSRPIRRTVEELMLAHHACSRPKSGIRAAITAAFLALTLSSA